MVIARCCRRDAKIYESQCCDGVARVACAFDDSGANPMMMMTHSRSGGSPADVTTSENLGVLIMSSRRRASNCLAANRATMASMDGARGRAGSGMCLSQTIDAFIKITSNFLPRLASADHSTFMAQQYDRLHALHDCCWREEPPHPTRKRIDTKIIIFSFESGLAKDIKSEYC